MSHSTQHQATLSNGLQLVGETSLLNKSCAIGFFVKTGARDEQPAESGLSHFLEHMMFKGTEKRNALEITFELGNIGAQANAYTSDENTVYYAGVIPDYFVEMQELLSDMLRPSLVQEEFDTEKKVILEEIALYQDRPQFYLFENALREFFVDHPSGNSILGTTESVSALSSEQMRSYFARRYTPSNMTLAASGNYDWESFVERAESLCGSWETVETTREARRFSPVAQEKVFSKPHVNQSHIVLMSNGAGAQDEERYEFSLLSTIIGDHTGSRLYWDLVDKGIAESAGAENDSKDGTGCFMVYASCPEERLGEVEGALRRVLETANDFSEDDLERARNKLLSRIVLEGEMPLGRLMSLGLEFNYRQRVQTLQDEIDRVKAVTKESVLQALERFPFEEMSRFSLISE